MPKTNSSKNERLVAIICILFAIICYLASICIFVTTLFWQESIREYEANIKNLEITQIDEKNTYENEVNAINQRITICGYVSDVCISLGTSFLIVAIVDCFVKSRLENFNEDKEQINKMFRGGITDTVTSELQEFLNSPDGKNKKLSVQIICYGTGAFGDTIEKLHAMPNVSKLDIVMCDPYLAGVIGNKLGNQFKTEEKTLTDIITEFGKLNKVEIHQSKVLPTIRSICIRCKCGTPLFCAYQPYYMNSKTKMDSHLLTANINAHTNPFTITLKQQDDELANFAHFLNDEFNRLVGDKYEEECDK